MIKIPKVDKFALATFSLFLFIFWHLSSRMLQIRPDGWYVGHINLYGDLVFHLGFINKFLVTNSVIISNPFFADVKPNYPIFADWFTAQIARLNNLSDSLFISTLTGGILTVFVCRVFIKKFIKNERVVFISLLLFFFNGGFGFYYFFKDFQLSNQNFITFIFNLPRQYTDIKDLGYWWINNYLAYFLPQRGFLFAFPLTLTILLILYKGTNRVLRKHFIIAGILAGILPSVQAHSLFLIFLLCLFFVPASILNKNKGRKELILNWIIFAAISGLIAFLIFNSISSGQNPLKFVKFHPGWTSNENLIWFWLKNLGLFAILLPISLTWLFKKDKSLLLLYIPFMGIFILCNILIFQPWDFDNSKLLIYWYFASAIIVAFFIEKYFFQKKIAYVISGVLIIIILTLSGSIDIFRTFTHVTSYQIFNRIDLQVAQQIKNLTPKDSIFITAFNHNHPIPVLSGRSTLLGFEGWAWSHGLNYEKRKADIVKIYLGGKEAEYLIQNYKISYVTIGPQEKNTFIINVAFFKNFPQIPLAPGWVIYDVSNLRSNGNR